MSWAFKFDTTAVFTNKPNDTIAGVTAAGRIRNERTPISPEELDIDRAEIRRRNLIPAEDMPYKMGLIFRDGAPVIYDSGDYPECQAMAVERAR